MWAGAACPGDLASGEVSHRCTCKVHLQPLGTVEPEGVVHPTPCLEGIHHHHPPTDGQGLRSGACKMGRQPHASVLMLGNVVVCARVLLPPSPPPYVQGWCGDHRQVQLCPHRANSLVGGMDPKWARRWNKF